MALILFEFGKLIRVQIIMLSGQIANKIPQNKENVEDQLEESKLKELKRRFDNLNLSLQK